jgi:hypothetical protein
MKRSAFLAVLLFCGFIMSGCSNRSFAGESFADSKRDESGNVVLLDAPRMWSDWRQAVDRAVESEKAGRGPGGGITSWNAQWLRVIRNNQDRENAPKYIAYIMDARRAAGLPELVGYPTTGD